MPPSPNEAKEVRRAWAALSQAEQRAGELQRQRASEVLARLIRMAPALDSSVLGDGPGYFSDAILWRAKERALAAVPDAVLGQIEMDARQELDQKGLLRHEHIRDILYNALTAAAAGPAISPEDRERLTEAFGRLFD